MRVVVLGATGVVGASVIDALLEQAAVDTIGALAADAIPAKKVGVSYARVSLRHDDLGPHFRGADAVIHAAWSMQPEHAFGELWKINVDGFRRVLDALIREDVGTFVYCSSVAAYSPRTDGAPVNECWPTAGVPSSAYSRQRSEVERLLSEFERHHRRVRVARLRFPVVVTGTSRSALVGSALARWALARSPLRRVPAAPGLRFQVLHADDAAEVIRLVLASDARGAFNFSASEGLDAERLARLVGAPVVSVSPGVLRRVVDLGFRVRAHGVEPGFVDLAFRAPLMSSERAARELNLRPRWSAERCVSELVEAMRAERADLRAFAPFRRLPGFARS